MVKPAERLDLVNASGGLVLVRNSLKPRNRPESATLAAGSFHWILQRSMRRVSILEARRSQV